MGFIITGTGSSSPKFSAGNKFFEQLVDTTDEWITTRTGIKNRYILSGKETLTDIAIEAANKALEDANKKACELDLIICATMQGDYIIPSLSCLIQEAIGASCPAFDINAACSGFIYALSIADNFMSNGKCKNVLIVCADNVSKFIDYTDRSTCVLFGDGAGAVILSCGNGLKYMKLIAKGGKENLNITSACPKNPFKAESSHQGYLHMNGQEIFKFAVSAVTKAVKEAEKETGISADGISYFLLHQANGRIIEMAQSMLGQPSEKFPVNYSEYGNTSAASIPILLDSINRQGKLKAGDTLFMSAFGGGLTSGACIITWDKPQAKSL